MRYTPVVLLSCVIGLAFSISPTFLASMSVFIKPLASEFGWGRTQVSAAISVSTLMLAVCSPLIGPLLDKYGPRRVILMATMLFAAALASMSTLNGNYAMYLAIAALIGIAGTGSNAFAYLSILPNWFDKRYGLSLGIAMIGVGLGQLAAPLYANALVTEYGWRTAYLLIGLLIFLITVPNALFLLRDGPGDQVAKRTKSTASAPGASRAEAIAQPVFWRLSLSFFLITVAASGCIVHLVPLLTDHGMTPANAAAMAALIGSSLLLSRLITGVLLDYISASVIGIVCFAGAACGIAMLMIGVQGPLIPLSIILIGTAFGVEGDLMAFMTRRIFGMRAYGAIYGLMFGTFNAGIVLGPPLMGLSFDLTKSYRNGLTALFVIAIISVVLIGWPSANRPYQPEAQPTA
jgi:predicted MFS family arabinose efflux permease